MTASRLIGCVGLLGVLLSGSAAIAVAPEPSSTTPTDPTAPAATAESAAALAEPLPEITVEGKEPRFVSPTRLDQIGRIWAPVMINGKGPFRLVVDTGASHSALTPAAAAALGSPGADATTTRVTGFTGSAVVPVIPVSSMEVGELLLGPTALPVVSAVFGGAQGVLGNEGLAGKRISADFSHDKLIIARSHKERAAVGFSVVPLEVIEGGLLVAEATVGGIRCRAIIDTGSQASVGNLALRDALIHHPERGQGHADVVGVTLAVQTGDYVMAPNIEIGSLAITGAHIAFGNMYLFEHWKLTDTPVLLLGMDVLGYLDVLVIDYQMKELQIRLTHPRLPRADG